MCGSASEYVCRLRFCCFTKSLMNIRTMKKLVIVEITSFFSIYFKYIGTKSIITTRIKLIGSHIKHFTNFNNSIK